MEPVPFGPCGQDCDKFSILHHVQRKVKLNPKDDLYVAGEAKDLRGSIFVVTFDGYFYGYRVHVHPFTWLCLWF